MGKFCQCAFQPMSTGVFALVVVESKRTAAPTVFGKSPAYSEREREVHPCKRLSIRRRLSKNKSELLSPQVQLSGFTTLCRSSRQLFLTAQILNG